jgi:ribosomal small subunit protein bTHX
LFSGIVARVGGLFFFERCDMGRGDQRTRKGKIFAASYGKRRKRKPTKATAAKK